MDEQTPLLPDKQSSACCSNTLPCCTSKQARLSRRSSCSSQTDPNDDDCHLANQPWRYKCVALACAIFLAVGSHFAAHTLGAMKNTIKKEFGITNSQYGVLQSSVSIVNTVLPVLGGIFIDAFGTVKGSILTTVLITSGNVLVAFSTVSASLPIMILGRIMYGVGSGTVVIVQETILSQWFRGRSLAVVVALMMTVSRLASFAAQATVVPIANWTGWYGYGFWFSALLCIFSLFINLAYVVLLRRVSNSTNLACQAQQSLSRREKAFSWSKLMYLPHSYWLVVAMEFLLGGAWGCFLHINSEFVMFRYGFDSAHAAATASVAQILPIFLMPFLGLVVDRYGKRTWMVIGSGVLFCLALALLQWSDWPPMFGMLSFSLSLALGPIGLVSSVPIMLPLSLVGTGMGLIKSGTNIGASLFDIMTGLLQDADPHRGYNGVILFFFGIGSLAVLAGLTLCVLDFTLYDCLLDRSAAEARQAQDLNTKPILPYTTSTLRGKIRANWFYGGLYVMLVIMSWALFVKFVLF